MGRKIFLLPIFTVFFVLPVLGQNGLKNGNLFLLQKDKGSISVNVVEAGTIKELSILLVPEKSTYTTDQKSTVAVIDTSENSVYLFNIKTKRKTTLKIPFGIKPKSILLNKDNLFIGGEMSSEIMIQYNLQSKMWYNLQVPAEVMFPGKAVDDLIVNDSLLIAIDNIVMPKYALFYKLSPNGKLELSHYKEFKSNGAYESISQARITNRYLGLISRTYSGYSGATDHITIYDGLDLSSSFALSSNEHEKVPHSFADFAIMDDKLLIASKEKGLGIFNIKKPYFRDADEFGNSSSNFRVNTSRIKYERFEDEQVIKITIVPNTTTIILTVRGTHGKLRHEIREI